MTRLLPDTLPQRGRVQLREMTKFQTLFNLGMFNHLFYLLHLCDQ